MGNRGIVEPACVQRVMPGEVWEEVEHLVHPVHSVGFTYTIYDTSALELFSQVCYAKQHAFWESSFE